MRLNRLTLKNFKGVKTLTIEPQGKNLTISGENATGKTTVFDAFRWLLDGKDSQNRKDFEIKTLEADGEATHGLDHEVEAELGLGPKTITLKKTYREQWTKKRGSADSTFSGHTIDHHIDGVPVKQKEYDEAIDQIAPAEVFLLLTDPRYFNAALHWTRRREILLEVCGDVPDADVVASDKKLARLPEILGDRTIESHRKVIAEKRKEIQKELDRIPIRIDEVSQGLPEIAEIDRAAHDNNLKILDELIRSKEEQLIDIESGGRASTIRQHLAELQAEAQETLNRLRAQSDEMLNEHLKQKSALSREYTDAENAVQTLTANTEHNEVAVKGWENNLNDLREKWAAVDAEEYAEPQADKTCPACGQDLPVDQVEAAREKAQANFNQGKARRLEAVAADGKEIKTEIEKAQKETVALKTALEKAQKTAEAKLLEAQQLQKTIADFEKARADQEQHADYQNIIATIEADKKELLEIQNEKSTAIKELRAEITEHQNEKDASGAELYKLAQHAGGQARITELKEQERTLAAEYEELEQQQFMTDEFIKAKVGLLEGRINSKFEHATFKMFETYISGGIEPTCETLYQGVPYGSSLNNGARINIGLDIIRTLSEHYKFEAPIFIDNAEAITRLIEMPGQIIKLIVGPEKTLKVVMADQ